MTRFPRFLLALLLLAAIPALAQSPDFSVRIEAAVPGPKSADRVAVGSTVYYLVY